MSRLQRRLLLFVALVFAVATSLCRNANAQSDTFVLHSWETHPPPLSANWAVDEDAADSTWAAGTRCRHELSFVSPESRFARSTYVLIAQLDVVRLSYMNVVDHLQLSMRTVEVSSILSPIPPSCPCCRWASMLSLRPAETSCAVRQQNTRIRRADLGLWNTRSQ